MLAKLTSRLSEQSLLELRRSLQVLKLPSRNHSQFLQTRSDSFANKALFPLVSLRRSNILQRVNDKLFCTNMIVSSYRGQIFNLGYVTQN